MGSLAWKLVPHEIRAWSWRAELTAGLVNFLTAGYIIAVNPDILSQTGMDRSALITVTCMASAIGCFLMALWPRVPVLMAPGMGLNAFFTYTICLNMKVPWPTALGIVFIAGVLFILLTFTGFREKILNAIPYGLRLAIPVGIGLFIAFIGFRQLGLIIDHPATLVALGPIKPTVALGLAGLLTAFVLEYRQVRGSLLGVILAVTFIAMALGWVHTPEHWLSHPPSIAPIAFKLNPIDALQPRYWLPIFAFLYVALFDSLGTLTAIAYQAGLSRGEEIPRLGKMLMADAVGATAGAVLGTSTVTAYIESGAGVAAGGRTGWTALFTGILFLIAPIFAGVIAVVPPYATAVALIIVGIYMMQHVREINFKDWQIGAPAFLTAILMPLTYSISTGICFGILAYIGILIFTRQWRKLNPILLFIGFLSVVYVILSTRGLAHA